MQFSGDHIVSVVLIILCIVRDGLTGNKKSLELIQDEDTKVQFERLLASIANVNAERIDALERYSALDNYNIAKGVLRNYKNDHKLHSTRGILSLYDYDLERSNDGILHEYIKNLGRKNPGYTIDPKLRKLLNEFYAYHIDDDDEMKNELRYKIQNLYGNKFNNMTLSNDDVDDIYQSNEDGIEIDMANRNVVDSGEDSDDDDDDDDDFQRQGKSVCFHGRCKCLKACRCAYKSFCNNFACNKKTRRLLCRNCRIQCRLIFES